MLGGDLPSLHNRFYLAARSKPDMPQQTGPTDTHMDSFLFPLDVDGPGAVDTRRVCLLQTHIYLLCTPADSLTDFHPCCIRKVSF